VREGHAKLTVLIPEGHRILAISAKERNPPLFPFATALRPAGANSGAIGRIGKCQDIARTGGEGDSVACNRSGKRERSLTGVAESSWVRELDGTTRERLAAEFHRLERLGLGADLSQAIRVLGFRDDRVSVAPLSTFCRPRFGTPSTLLPQEWRQERAVRVGRAAVPRRSLTS